MPADRRQSLVNALCHKCRRCTFQGEVPERDLEREKQELFLNLDSPCGVQMSEHLRPDALCTEAQAVPGKESHEHVLVGVGCDNSMYR